MSLEISAPRRVSIDYSQTYTAKSHAPKVESDPALGSPMAKALQNLYKTASLNYQGVFGIGQPGSHGNQVARAHKAIDNLFESIARVVNSPVSNSPATAEFRGHLTELKSRHDDLLIDGHRTKAVHLTGSGLTRLPSMMAVMQDMFQAAGMGPLTQFRDVGNLSPNQL